MAKKVVATLQGGAGSKKMTKVIKMVKSSKSGAYVFEEKVMNADEVEGYLKKYSKKKKKIHLIRVWKNPAKDSLTKFQELLLEKTL